MWPFSKSLESVLNKTKSVRVHGVKFDIKKIDPSNYLDGSKVMLQLYDVYKVGNTASPEVTQKTMEKVKEHYTDIFMSSVVSPKLKRKPDGDGLLIDNLFTEWNLAHELYAKIMEYTYGKKKNEIKYFARDKLLDIDLISKRYGVLPSTIKNGTIDDLQFNMLVATMGIEAENKAQARANKKPVRSR